MAAWPLEGLVLVCQGVVVRSSYERECPVCLEREQAGLERGFGEFGWHQCQLSRTEGQQHQSLCLGSRL